MALSGSLKEFSVVDVLTLLTQQGKTGTLKLNNLKKSRAVLMLSGGKIVNVTVSKRSPESIVKQILLNERGVKTGVYNELFIGAKKTKADFTELLVIKGFLKKTERDTWYQIAAEDLVLQLFSWKQGQYTFEAHEIKPEKISTLYNLSADFLILEGMRRIDEWPKIRARINDGSMVFSVIKPDYEEYDLGEDEHVISKIDGNISVASLLKSLPFGDFRLLSSVCNLWEQEFIEPIQNIEKKKKSQKKTGPANYAQYFGISALCFICTIISITCWSLFVWINPTKNPHTATEENQKQTYVENAVIEYSSDHGFLPVDLKTLVNSGYLSRCDLITSGGVKFIYNRVSKSSYSLTKPR